MCENKYRSNLIIGLNCGVYQLPDVAVGAKKASQYTFSSFLGTI